jgi:AbiTii
MSLLNEIQAAVIQEGREIGPILLRLRLLASRLESAPLEEWVRHESEGYPDEAPLPDYRVINVSYSGTFSGQFGGLLTLPRYRRSINALLPPQVEHGDAVLILRESTKIELWNKMLISVNRHFLLCHSIKRIRGQCREIAIRSAAQVAQSEARV